MTCRILILGGTTEARLLAARLAADGGLEVTLSLAGRTARPADHAVPLRIGGFGGVDGLAAHLRAERIDLLVDATHPFAARISANAAEAARQAGIALLALRRPPWERVAGDRWTDVESAAEALAVLGPNPRRVFVALGRQELAPLEAHPQHCYIIRSVDPVELRLDLPDATYLLARGPFVEEEERQLLADHRIDAIIAKNSGGMASYGKIAAARELGIEVMLIRRPAKPEVRAVATVEEALAAIAHLAASAEKRGV